MCSKGGMGGRSGPWGLGLLLGMTLAGAAYAQASGDAAQNKSPRNSIPYSGGGIRGNQDIVADGSLVTESEAREFQGEAGFLVPLPQRSRSLRPDLEILEPRTTPGQRHKTPFTLAVRFGALDAPIEPATLRVFYGPNKVDITERITRTAQVGPEGFTMQARLPPGRHMLTLQIEDAKRRAAVQELRLEVE